MSDILESWLRPHYEPGGGNPFLFYVVFGSIANSIPLSRSRYRVDAAPKALEIASYGSGTHPEVLDSFREGFPWEELMRSDHELGDLIDDQECCLLLRGEFDDSSSLDYLRDTIGMVTYFLDQGGVAVFDPQAFEWWSPECWRERIFDPCAAVPSHHVKILFSSNGDGTEWVHTRGLRKFGRPDISIPRVSEEWRDGAMDLCNRFIEFQAFGGRIVEGMEIKTRTFPAGFYCYHRGDLDDPDFNNVHVSIEPLKNGG